MIRRLLAISALSLPLAACGGLSAEDARAFWGSVEGSLQSGAGNSASQPLSVNVDVDANCRYGGEMTFDGALNVEEDGAPGTFGSTFAYEVSYDACQHDENTLDGVVQYASELRGQAGDGAAEVSYVYVYQGTLAVSGEQNGTCDFNLEGRVVSSAEIGDGHFGAETHVVYAGTLCGHDADEVLNVDVEEDSSASVDVDFNP